MSIITKLEIKRLIESEQLVRNYRTKNNEPDLENTSYDLVEGVTICKKESKKIFEKRINRLVLV